jgi:hypothetical protein
VSDVPCDIDRFAATIGQLLGDVAESCGDEMEKCVRRAVRKGARELRGERTEGIGRDPANHPWSDEYRKGFSSRTERDGLNTTGEVGNKVKPGLVHLLEKGHLTLTDRRTRAYPHMEPTFRDMEEDFVEDAEKAIGKAVM